MCVARMQCVHNIVYFVRLHLRDDVDEVGGVAKISVVQEQLHPGGMTIFVNVIDAASVEGRGGTDDAVYLGGGGGLGR